MIFDSLDHAPRYYGLGVRFARALEWLAHADVGAMTPGERVAIDGDDIYATLLEVDTLPIPACKLEAHRRYADIQYLASGTERLGYALLGAMPPLGEYDEANDIAFFTGQWDTLRVRPGDFYIVFPQDLHAPRVADNAPCTVRRVIVKVRL